MDDIDIASLRKHYGMTQAELAKRMQIKQSFLSVIENRKSPLPAHKREILRTIFSDEDLRKFRFKEKEISLLGRINSNESAVISQLFNTFHSQLHRESDAAQKALLEAVEALKHTNSSLTRRNEVLESQNAVLLERYDRLSQQNDELREKITELIRQMQTR